jgi:transcriptional regulator with XRE-family HTH domain
MPQLQILTDVARRVIQSPAKALYLEEWMLIRGVTRQDVIEALDTTDATISRWIRGRRKPRQGDLRRLEELLSLDPGGLYKPPSEAAHAELLAGLDKDARAEALRFIAFLRARPK